VDRVSLDQNERYEDGFVEVRGARVHFVRAGAGSPMLLIHGLVGSTSNWNRNLGVLAQVRNVCAIDLLNAGKSQRIRGLDAGLVATADRVIDAMDALGMERADIAGHSHGGAVAMMVAARHPERVRSLVLFAPVNPFCPLAGRMVRMYSTVPGRWLAKCAPFVPRRLQWIAIGRMYGDPARVGEECIREYMAGLRVSGTVDHILEIVHLWFGEIAKLQDVLPKIANVPTLLVWGDRDPAVSVASGERLKQEMRAAELRVIPGGGHVVFEELPEESNRVMLEWLRRDAVADGVRLEGLSAAKAEGVLNP
jgi:pimeloyl-ACP methyl ester carboxylesterase